MPRAPDLRYSDGAMHARVRLLAVLLLLTILGSPAVLPQPASAAAPDRGFALSADDGGGALVALRPAQRHLGPQGEWRSAPADGESEASVAPRTPCPRCLAGAAPSYRSIAPHRPDCRGGASGNRGPPLRV